MQRRLNGPKIVIMSTMIFMFLLAFWLLVSSVQNSGKFYSQHLNNGWTVYLNDELVVNPKDPVDGFNFGRTPRLTKIDMYYDLSSELADNSIELLLYLSSVRAYVDDELIYDFGYDGVMNDTMVGSGYHFINLPSDVDGKTLHISIITNEKNAFTSLFSPVATKSSDVYKAFADKQIVNIIISCFILTLGLVLMLAGIAASFYEKSYVYVFFIGVFALSMGVWTVCTNKIHQMFSLSMSTFTTLEYVSLYFAPIPLALLIWYFKKDQKNWRNRLIVADGMCLFGFFVVSTVLHFTNIIRYPKVLTTYHMLGGIVLVLLFFAGFVSVKEKSHSEMMLTVALVELLVSIALDLLRFNIHKYMFPNRQMLNYSFMLLGTLGFILLLILSFLINIYDMVMSKAEKETLTRLAYTDSLTGIGNRAKYNLEMKEHDEKCETYALINLDLNGLKEVNDTFGHDEGDILLKKFADVMSDVFTAYGDCYRIGGDEFIVLVTSRYMSGIEFALQRLEDRLEEVSKKSRYAITASYGVANTDEVEGSFHEKVYFLADQRMYKMKQKIHGEKNVNS